MPRFLQHSGWLQLKKSKHSPRNAQLRREKWFCLSWLMSDWKTTLLILTDLSCPGMTFKEFRKTFLEYRSYANTFANMNNNENYNISEHSASPSYRPAWENTPHWTLVTTLWSGCHHSSLSFSFNRHHFCWESWYCVFGGLGLWLGQTDRQTLPTPNQHQRQERRGWTQGSSAPPSCEVWVALSSWPTPAVAPTLFGWAASKLLRAGSDLGELTENLKWTKEGVKEEAAWRSYHFSARREAAGKLISEKSGGWHSLGWHNWI